MPRGTRRASSPPSRQASTALRFVAECPAIPGCVSQGRTKPEALQNVRKAIELCLEVRAELNQLVTSQM